MHIQVDRKDFLEGIQIVQRAAASSTNLPILTGIYLAAKEGQLELRATDNDIGIEYFLPVQIREEGEIVLPARYLVEIARRFKPGEIKLQVAQDTYTALLESGRSSFELLGFSPDNYPERVTLGQGKAWQVEQSLLRDMIRQTAFAASHDNMRPILTGVLMNFTGDKLELVATDSHRLAFYRTVLPRTGGEEASMVVPRRTMEELARIIQGGEEEPVTIQMTGGQVCFSTERVRLISRLIEGKFIDYRQVLPKEYKTRVRLETGEFLAAVERAAILTQDRANSLRIEVGDGLIRLFANTPEVGKVEEEIQAEVTGEDTSISFNSRYLIEALRTVEEAEIFFDITGSVSPGIIRPVGEEKDYLHLIMPVTTRAVP
ncbi:MAG TPA: DNA polymerase III subunit beta [Firmicutes bacterium]|nr:DNA polymerase III subunit beta [Bacillota bacterium]